MQPAAWDTFRRRVDALRLAVRRSTSQTVYSRNLLNPGRELAQQYFRDARPELAAAGATDGDLAELDQAIHRLLDGVNTGRVQKTVLARSAAAVARSANRLDPLHQRQLGTASTGGASNPSAIESLIVSTLDALVPTAGLSYRQALRDLMDPERVSYRGTANELRETLREVLDHLAPDDRVMSAPGFRLEPDRIKPTQRQKALHVMRSRGAAASQRRVTSETIALIEQLVASVTRSSSERSSLATHVSSTRAEVLTSKQYVEAVLADLLEIHVR
jgi:hypothetical protein